MRHLAFHLAGPLRAGHVAQFDGTVAGVATALSATRSPNSRSDTTATSGLLSGNSRLLPSYMRTWALQRAGRRVFDDPAPLQRRFDGSKLFRTRLRPAATTTTRASSSSTGCRKSPPGAGRLTVSGPTREPSRRRSTIRSSGTTWTASCSRPLFAVPISSDEPCCPTTRAGRARLLTHYPPTSRT